tara:strand:+ start:6834 stop:7034 length:201 start_codon:yes stop_codon:yes gene_type:complete
MQCYSIGIQTITMPAKKLLENMSRQISLADDVVHVSASIGAGIYPDDFADIEIMTKHKILNRADYQ